MFLPSDITLQFGDSGDFVAEMQRRLVAVSAGGKNIITGHFDGMTVNAVSAFQARHGIRADGIAGPDTLRRLNAVYSGDGVSETDAQQNEDEEKEKAAAAFQHQLAAQQTGLLTPEPMFGIPVVEEPLLKQEAAATPTQHAAYSPPMPEVKPAIDPQEQLRAQIQREMAMQQQQPIQQQPPALSPADMLAQMMKETPAQQAEMKAERVPQPAPATAAMAERPPLAAAAQQAIPPQPDAMAAPANAQPAQNPEQVSREVTTLTREPSPNLFQRSMQKLSDAMQRLADHFEAKVKPADLQEALEAGRIMAKAGVKEAAIPQGPELAGRGPELPSRGPEAAQGQQRA